MRIFYGQQAGRMPEGATFRNPRFFVSPEAGAEHVTLDGDWPGIEAAYAALGVPVERLEAADGAGTAAAAASAVLGHPGGSAEPFAGEIPEDWADLPWPQLRKLAVAISGAVILNKAEAEAAIRAELERRDAAAGADEAEQGQP